jgi:transposase
MQDVELYAQILGLTAPWRVAGVALKMEEGRVEIAVEHESDACFACPKCGREASCYDHSPERSWRHLDTCQLRTLLSARVPRVSCPEHGVVQVAVPWAEPHGRFTLLMERLVIEALLACQTTQGACRLLRISWDQAWHVLERAVRRGRARKQAVVVPRIGVDEKAFRRGHSYVTVVCDVGRGTVEYVADEREKASLAGYYAGLTAEQREGIEAVAMDMWDPYVQATREALPEAERKIVFDRFHVMQHVTKAVDQVRKQENRRLVERDDDRLKKTKYLWLFSEENLPEKRQAEFDRLKTSDLKTARAWALKENLRHLWNYATPVWAKRFFRGWYAWASRSRLEPIWEAAQTLWRRLDNIVTYCKHQLTNAVSEGLNSKIMAVKRRAAGFRNPIHFKTAIYFHCGGLEMHP